MRFARVRVLQDIQAIDVSHHQAILDAVVHHLHKMPRARRTAVQIALFRCTANLFASWRAWYIAAARSERLEDGIEAFHNRRFPADHLAIAAIESPNAAARPNIAVVNSFRRKLLCATNVLNVIRIST